MPKFRHRRTGREVEPSTEVQAGQYFADPKRWEVIEGGAFIEETEVPDGTVAEVLAWVGDDPDRANAALEAEEQGKRRKGLIKALS